MNRWSLFATITLLSIPAASPAQVEPSPCADARSREVPSLSPAEVEDLRAGAGMGLARPAELHGHPGPRHVLELADSLDLSRAQRRRVHAIRVRMRDEAIELGQRLIDAERDLGTLFAAGDVDHDDLVRRVEAVAEIRARLRLVHLRAHVATRAALSRHQVREYDRLRGYGDGHEHGGDRHEAGHRGGPSERMLLQQRGRHRSPLFSS